MKGEVVIKANGVGVDVKVNLQEIGKVDKCMLMHSLAQALDMDDRDMHVYMMMEISKVFHLAQTTEIRIPLRDEGVDDNEG